MRIALVGLAFFVVWPVGLAVGLLVAVVVDVLAGLLWKEVGGGGAYDDEDGGGGCWREFMTWWRMFSRSG